MANGESRAAKRWAAATSYDARFRQAALQYVEAAAEASGGVITREQLEWFTFEGEQVKLIDQGRGIRNPRQLPATISILHDPHSRYDDDMGSDGLFRYSIRSGTWDAGDNRKLHEAYELGVPLIMLQKLRDGVFVPLTHVYIVGEEPHSGEFGRYVLALDAVSAGLANHVSAPERDLERRYVERMTRQRLHQPMFRAKIMEAYRRTCSVCELRHVELLDAAHIIDDVASGGEPVTSNGLALCKIHHAAFDRHVLGIDTRLSIHIANEGADGDRRSDAASRVAGVPWPAPSRRADPAIRPTGRQPVEGAVRCLPGRVGLSEPANCAAMTLCDSPPGSVNADSGCSPPAGTSGGSGRGMPRAT